MEISWNLSKAQTSCKQTNHVIKISKGLNTSYCSEAAFKETRGGVAAAYRRSSCQNDNVFAMGGSGERKAFKKMKYSRSAFPKLIHTRHADGALWMETG